MDPIKGINRQLMCTKRIFRNSGVNSGAPEVLDSTSRIEKTQGLLFKNDSRFLVVA